MNSVQRPGVFESAVKDKEAAKENIRVAENERPRLLLQAETELEQAKKQSEIIRNDAETQAKIIKNKYFYFNCIFSFIFQMILYRNILKKG